MLKQVPLTVTSLALFLLLSLFSSLVAVAQEENDADPVVETEEQVEGGGADEGGSAEDQAIYLPIKPPIIVNYGGAGRLHYLKTDISIRTKTIDAANAIRYHMPFVRNNLIMLFASQTNDTVSSQEGREKMRLDALEEVREIVEREHKTPRDHIVDLYFNNFIVQK